MEIVDDTLPVDLEAFLARSLFCFLATSAEGKPRVSPLWYVWEEGAIWIVADTDTKSYPDRVEQNPTAALAVVDFDPAVGRVQHVGMRGTAALEPFDEARANRLFRRYLGDDDSAWDERFTGPWDRQRWRFIRFEPDTVVARDQSYEGSLDSAELR